MSASSERGQMRGDVSGSESSGHFAYVAHHIPGRARIRVPTAKRNPQLLRRVADAAAKVGGAKGIETNPMTGSVLIHYERSGFARFLELLAEALEGILVLAEPELAAEEAAIDLLVSGPSSTAKAVADGFRYLDRELKIVSGNTLDLRLLVPLAAVAVSLSLVSDPMSTPLWLTLAIFSMSSFLQLNQN